MFIREVRKTGIKISMQYHDEILFYLLKQDKDIVKEKLYNSIKKVNDMLKLNIELAISMDFGVNYSQTH